MTGPHAIVIGASMGGLLAARALVGPFATVTVLDRDELPSDSRDRKGVPQGRHAHTLLSRGADTIGAMFPGLLDELEADGAAVLRHWDAGHVTFGGRHFRLPDGPADQAIYQSSRAFLETRVRARVRALPGVEVLEHAEVTALTAGPGAGRVTGVRVRRGGVETELAADLVVDSTGRGGRAHVWLEELGYAAAPEEKLPIDLVYRTRHLRMPAESIRGVRLVAVQPRSGRPRGMFLLGIEHDRWYLTLSGYGDHQPPAESAAFDAFLAELVPDWMMTAIRGAEHEGDIITHRYPANLRRRYEKLDRFPAGFLVFGDAFCSFNPFYGQGMTVSALQAQALRSCLVRGPGLEDLPCRFFKAGAKAIDPAWGIALAEDLALAEVEGRRSLRVRARNAFSAKACAAATHDPVVAEAYVRVVGLLNSELSLGSPPLALRILRGARTPAPTPDNAAPAGVATESALV